MPITRNSLDPSKLNADAGLPIELRLDDFRSAVQDVYDFFFDVNTGLTAKGLERLDDMLRPAIMSGLLSDMLTASLARHSRTLVVNGYFNGHPDLIVRGEYAGNAVKSGELGVEIKTTRVAVQATVVDAAAGGVEASLGMAARARSKYLASRSIPMLW